LVISSRVKDSMKRGSVVGVTMDACSFT